MEVTLADIVYDFHYGCSSGNLEKVRQVLNIDGLQQHDNAGTYLYEGLRYAIGNNRNNIIEYLLFSPEIKKPIEYNPTALFPILCKNKSPEIIQFIINDMNNRDLPIDYTQGFINACDSDNFPILELLLSQEDIRKKIPTDIQLKKFEDGIKKDSLDTIKYYLNSKHLTFNIYCNYYLKRKKIVFDPFTPRIKMSKQVDSYMSAFELRINLELTYQQQQVKNFSKFKSTKQKT